MIDRNNENKRDALLRDMLHILGIEVIDTDATATDSAVDTPFDVDDSPIADSHSVATVEEIDYAMSVALQNGEDPLTVDLTPYINQVIKERTDDSLRTHLFGGIDSTGEAVCSPDCWCNQIIKERDE